MSDPVLSLEAVRALSLAAKAMPGFLVRGPMGEAVTDRTIVALCATVEHHANESDRLESQLTHDSAAARSEHSAQMAEADARSEVLAETMEWAMRYLFGDNWRTDPKGSPPYQRLYSRLKDALEAGQP